MKKSVFQKEVADQIVRRTDVLNESSKPLWGKMSSAQMLRHCNDVNLALLETKPSKIRPTTTRQYINRFVLFHVVSQIPKNVRGPQRFSQTDVQPDFAAELSRFKKIMGRYPAHGEPISLSHPYLGKLSTRQWGQFLWMHLDHHLRQFGA